MTNDLDEGPIIEQDIERVDHRDDAEALKILVARLSAVCLPELSNGIWKIESLFMRIKRLCLIDRLTFLEAIGDNIKN